MFHRRIGLAAMAAAVLIIVAGAVPAAAANPTRQVRIAERPLTRSERAASDRKVADAMRYLASPAASFGLATLGCPTPESTPQGGERVSLTAAFTAADCEIPGDFLGVSARDP